MRLESQKFLCPTKRFRELNMLLLIGENPWLSQHSLAKEMGITSAMANIYMKELMSRQMVVAEGETNRQKRYYLTPKGKRRKCQLLNEYIRDISGLYSFCKREFEGRLQDLYRKGIRRVVFFGAAETGEIAFQAAQNTKLEIVGIVDNDQEKHDKRIGGIQVSTPERISDLQPDGVIITALAHGDEIYEQLKPFRDKGMAVKRF